MVVHQLIPLADTAVICDVNRDNAEKARDRIAAEGGGHPEIVKDYREVLDRDDIDIVGNATPDHWHTKINVEACLAGKDVYAEKPITLTVDEGKVLRSVVQRTGRIVQVGAQQRSFQNFEACCRMVRHGHLGRLKRVGVLIPFSQGNKGGPYRESAVPASVDWDLFTGPAVMHPYMEERLRFRRFFDYSGGLVTDWGHHHMDIAHWGMGMEESGPLSIEARGYFPHAGRQDYPTNTDCFAARMEYPDGLELWFLNAWDRRFKQSIAEGYPPSAEAERIHAGVPEEFRDTEANGVLFTGEKGSLLVNRSGLFGDAAATLETQPDAKIARSGRQQALLNHMANFIDCVDSREKPISDVATQHRSVAPCHLANISMRLGRKLDWDPLRERFPNDAEASKWLKREPREGYGIDLWPEG